MSICDQSTCDILGNVGIDFIRTSSISQPPSNNNDGEKILQNHYSKLWKFKTSSIQEPDYIPGSYFGSNYFMSVNISKLPEIADFDEIKCDEYFQRNSNLTFQEIEEKKSVIKAEIAEKEILKGMKDYFASNNEDVLIFCNQDFQDIRRGIYLERDICVINMTKGYFLVVEAKATFHQAQCKTATRQLAETKDILKYAFANKFELKQRWNIITIIYCTTIDDDVKICSLCKNFVIVKNKGDIVKNLDKALSGQTTKHWKYVGDFFCALNYIIPKRARIGKELLNENDTKEILNRALLEELCQNLKISNQALNIFHWSDSSDLPNFHRLLNLTLKKVFFDSGYATGKREFLINCAEKLLKGREKVLFIINTSCTDIQNTPSLIQLKLEDNFQNYCNSQNFKFMVQNLNINTKQGNENLIKSHPDFNILIDELMFDNKIVDHQSLISWSHLTQKRHLWISLGFRENEFDRNQISNYFFLPNLNYAMTCPSDIIKHLKSGFGNLNKIIGTFKIHSNLPTFLPLSIKAPNFKVGFELSLEVLNNVVGDKVPAMFVLDFKDLFSSSQLISHIHDIYQNFLQRDIPAIYFGTETINEAKDWITNSNKYSCLLQGQGCSAQFEGKIALENHLRYVCKLPNCGFHVSEQNLDQYIKQHLTQDHGMTVVLDVDQYVKKKSSKTGCNVRRCKKNDLERYALELHLKNHHQISIHDNETHHKENKSWKYEHKNDLITDLKLTQGLKEKVVIAFQNEKYPDYKPLMLATAIFIAVNIPESEFQNFCFLSHPTERLKQKAISIIEYDKIISKHPREEDSLHRINPEGFPTNGNAIQIRH